eukprot:CAMPEP_0185572878 /NCGR_PEP_ID=MMETSP0434-20130131/4733_1 /TAXON_ID=626734 ORGANISM="Favella taraikaensis, Strain Fe Narragansett Bay" /NCGR_SAMPLE_ID=MMETSP0434 /ASSEMBLY_ACC=CAM_ASM_000379 /LENGTH=73 /DNA_ID=CAMNT_0028188919 /DNA_START=1571 /DNA_END=1792 /DNA_ORIENTATION=+
MRRESESVTKGSGLVITEANDESITRGSRTVLGQTKRLSSDAIAERADDTVSATSSSSEEPMDGEGRMAIKDI